MTYMTHLIALLTTFLIHQQLAFGAHPYYGVHGDQIENNQMQGEELREELLKILTQSHTPQPGSYDLISRHCQGRRCYKHRALGYQKARKVLMGSLHLQQLGGKYYVEDIYCQKLLGSRELNGNAPGPGRIPKANIINTEHTWPQSRFNRRFQISLQKSDLHALFPVSSKVNSIRSNHEFAEVDLNVKVYCGHSKSGRLSRNGRRYFEPPQEHKGNVARALFYFATHYKMKISGIEESFLRRWHKEDPVDRFEIWRNEEIAQAQGVRNPYIDHPHLVDAIPNF